MYKGEKTMKKQKYYGIAGVNAYGVYDDYEKVLESRQYIAKFKNRRFDDFEEAKEWAEWMYEELQADSSIDYDIKELRQVNWCYFRQRK